ncbi:MAG: hypothetical protein LBH75_07525 [Treponema sp.]|nr:hypothetical protein [Treponema sp.]
MRILQSLAALALLTSAVVCGCDNGNSSVSSVPDGEKKGRIIIPLPKNSVQDARSIELGTAQAYTNFYEAVFINDNATLSVTAGAGVEQIEANVVEGVYTILLAAGYKSGLTAPLLLGSGYVQGQAINDGENIVEITLKTIAVDIIAPAEVVQNKIFTMQIDVDTKNPLITLTTLPLSFNPTAAGVRTERTDFSNNGTVYTWMYEVGAPSTTGSIKVFIAHSFSIVSKSNWYIGYYNANNNHFSEVKDNYQKTITIIADDNLPKVNLVIGWET